MFPHIKQDTQATYFNMKCPKQKKTRKSRVTNISQEELITIARILKEVVKCSYTT